MVFQMVERRERVGRGGGIVLASDLFWLDQHFDLHVSIRWGKKDSSFTSFGSRGVDFVTLRLRSRSVTPPGGYSPYSS